MPRVTQTSVRMVTASYEVVPIWWQLGAVTAGGGTLWRYRPERPGRVLRLDFVTFAVGAGAGATMTITPYVNGVQATGGDLAITLAGTNTVGELTEGNAVVAGGDFTENDEIELRAGTVTVFTAGFGHVNMLVEYGTQTN